MTRYVVVDAVRDGVREILSVHRTARHGYEHAMEAGKECFQIQDPADEVRAGMFVVISNDGRATLRR